MLFVFAFVGYWKLFACVCVRIICIRRELCIAISDHLQTLNLLRKSKPSDATRPYFVVYVNLLVRPGGHHLAHSTLLMAASRRQCPSPRLADCNPQAYVQTRWDLKHSCIIRLLYATLP